MEQQQLMSQFNKDVQQVIEASLKTFTHCGRFVRMIHSCHNGDGYAATKQMLKKCRSRKRVRASASDGST